MGSALLAPLLLPALLPLRRARGPGREVQKTLLTWDDLSLDRTSPMQNLK